LSTNWVVPAWFRGELIVFGPYGSQETAQRKSRQLAGYGFEPLPVTSTKTVQDGRRLMELPWRPPAPARWNDPASWPSSLPDDSEPYPLP
jgi:hypothetical protein